MEGGGGRVDVELPVNSKVLWDREADKIQLNKPNRAEFCSSKATDSSTASTPPLDPQ